MRGPVRLEQVTVDPTGHPQGRYLHVEGRGTSVVSAVLSVLQTSRRALPEPRTFSGQLPLPSSPRPAPS